MGLFDFFSKAKNTFNQSALTKEKKEEAERLVRSKKLREAVNIAEEVLAQWSDNSFFGGQIARNFLLGEILDELESQLANWQNIINKTEQKAIRAKDLVASDTENPFETEAISQAIDLYQQCNNSVFDKRYHVALTSLKQKLEWRQRFQNLLSLGEQAARKGFYKQSLAHFLEAENLFKIAKLQRFIDLCRSKIPQEESYEAQLHQVRQMAIEGRFKEAFVKFKPVFKSYPRSDGKKFLQDLQRVLKGKQYFCEGLIAEKRGYFSVALKKYREAEKLTPELTECKNRLAIVAVKGGNYSQALSQLEVIDSEKAAYLRGFIYAKQGKLQQADREWKSITDFNIQPQREILKVLANRDRLQRMQTIEKLVDAEDLEAAKIASINFIDTYGIEPTIQSNLEEHIKPRLENYIWQNKDWQKITSELKGNFTQNLTVTLLHNWAIANYYQAQVEPSRITNWITTWFTALANLHLDPALQNITWLRNEKVDLEVISDRLIKQVEERINKVKDSNLEEYLKLRDCYRLDKVAFFYFKNNPGSGLRVNECLILPGCYQSYSNDFSNTVFPAETWGTLYTNWGKAVAACLDRDTGHAIQIKPVHSPNTDVEKFAQIFVSYYEGRYYLDNKEWRKAVKPLKLAKGEIEKNSVWSKEIDLFCQKNRGKIDRQDIQENLQFAEFWDNLVSSQSSKSYLVEYRTEEVREQLVNKTINFRTALQRLKAVKSIDPNNPVLLDFIENVEIAQEGEEIDRLLSRNKFEEAVQRAKRSRHDRIRYLVAEMCIEILLDGAESRRLPYELIIQLGRWAYELCPNEPAFKPIYNQLGIYY